MDYKNFVYAEFFLLPVPGSGSYSYLHGSGSYSYLHGGGRGSTSRDKRETYLMALPPLTQVSFYLDDSGEEEEEED